MLQRYAIGRFLTVCFVLTILTAAAEPDATSLAKAILDDSKPRAERETLVLDNPKLSAELIAAMTSDLTSGTKEEYRRIPWIWRVAIAAGKRNDPAEMKRILDVALPQKDQPLDDWRVVVIGGGIINGITQAGAWPDEQISKMIPPTDPAFARWSRTLELGAVMVDDAKVATGTRYDALRLLGVEPWDRRGAVLMRYQLRGIEPELQMGAVSALGDVRDAGAAVAQVLISGLPHYNPTNRELALDAMIRDEIRALELLDTVARGTIKPELLGNKRIDALRSSKIDAVKLRAEQVLPKP